MYFDSVLTFTSFVDLARMYQLVSRIQDGLGELKSLLEKHIWQQGLQAIEKCGESALNVSSHHKGGLRSPRSYSSEIRDIVLK